MAFDEKPTGGTPEEETKNQAVPSSEEGLQQDTSVENSGSAGEADQKAARKRGNPWRTATIATICAAAVGIIGTVCYYNSSHPAKIYRTGVTLFDSESYDAAEAQFAQIPNYRDSASYLEQIAQERRYENALTLYGAGRYDEASAIFTELGDYKDSSDYVQEIANSPVYEQALEAYRNGSYDEAQQLLSGLSGYKDSDQIAAQISSDLSGNAYTDSLSDYAFTAQTGAIRAQSLLDQLMNVWYNSVYHLDDASTDAYTKDQSGNFVEFSDAVASFLGSETYQNQYALVASAVTTVTGDYNALGTAPEGYESAREKADALQEAFTALTDLTVADNVTGSYDQMAQAVSTAEKNFAAAYADLEDAIPGKRTITTDVSVHDFRNADFTMTLDRVEEAEEALAGEDAVSVSDDGTAVVVSDVDLGGAITGTIRYTFDSDRRLSGISVIFPAGTDEETVLARMKNWYGDRLSSDGTITASEEGGSALTYAVDEGTSDTKLYIYSGQTAAQTDPAQARTQALVLEEETEAETVTEDDPSAADESEALTETQTETDFTIPVLYEDTDEAAEAVTEGTADTAEALEAATEGTADAAEPAEAVTEGTADTAEAIEAATESFAAAEQVEAATEGTAAAEPAEAATEGAAMTADSVEAATEGTADTAEAIEAATEGTTVTAEPMEAATEGMAAAEPVEAAAEGTAAAEPAEAATEGAAMTADPVEAATEGIAGPAEETEAVTEGIAETAEAAEATTEGAIHSLGTTGAVTEGTADPADAAGEAEAVTEETVRTGAEHVISTVPMTEDATEPAEEAASESAQKETVFEAQTEARAVPYFREASTDSQTEAVTEQTLTRTAEEAAEKAEETAAETSEETEGMSESTLEAGPGVTADAMESETELETEEETEEERYDKPVEITATSAGRIYEEPYVSIDIMEKYTVGEKLTAVGEEGDWYIIELDDQTGYVRKDAFRETEAQ